MSSFEFLVKQEYEKNPNLKKEDVEALLVWIKKQPHLPSNVTEFQVILFLHSCYYSNEAAKKTIDVFYTLKSRNPPLFQKRNPFEYDSQVAIQTSIGCFLPKKTPEGFQIHLLKLMETNPDNFDLFPSLRCLDISVMLSLYQNGTSNGNVVIIDLKGITFGHLTKFLMAGPSALKSFFDYIQEGMPVRLKAAHFLHATSYFDKLMNIMGPFLKKQTMEMIHFHSEVEKLTQFVPLECLPEDYGGSVEPTEILQMKFNDKFENSSEILQWEDQQIRMVDESKRDHKTKKNFESLDGTFKKLEID